MLKKIIGEYIWIGGNGELRSKAKTIVLDQSGNLPNPIPETKVNGIYTGQAFDKESEIIIRPCSFFPCPFRKEKNILILCDTYKVNGLPLEGNNRFLAKEIFEKNLSEKPIFSIKQELYIIDNITNLPLHFNKNLHEGQFYCSIGSLNSFGRVILEKFYNYCLYANLNIAGINLGVGPAQWSFQIGPNEDLHAGDHLYIARYIINRISEEFNVSINIQPKPLKGNWKASQCYVKFSTKKMRESYSLSYIYEIIDKLKKKHDDHLKVYGTGNYVNLNNKNDNFFIDKFFFDIENQNSAIKVPNKTLKLNNYYLEDIRPSSNMDPYLVTSIIFKTIAL